MTWSYCTDTSPVFFLLLVDVQHNKACLNPCWARWSVVEINYFTCGWLKRNCNKYVQLGWRWSTWTLLLHLTLVLAFQISHWGICLLNYNYEVYFLLPPAVVWLLTLRSPLWQHCAFPGCEQVGASLKACKQHINAAGVLHIIEGISNM